MSFDVLGENGNILSGYSPYVLQYFLRILGRFKNYFREFRDDFYDANSAYFVAFARYAKIFLRTLYVCLNTFCVFSKSNGGRDYAYAGIGGTKYNFFGYC
jgi:hypothetical protein